MKKLVTVAEVKQFQKCGDKRVIFIDGDTLITPAAKDLAAEFGVVFEANAGKTQTPPQAAKQRSEPESGHLCFEGQKTKAEEISPGLISKIVQEVIVSILGPLQQGGIVKEADPSGVRLVRGETVVCEDFNTGNPRDRVGIREILTTKESPNMATGFMTIEQSSFSWDVKYEEIDYIVDGTLEISVNGKTYIGKPGDVFFIPCNTRITFSSPDKAKFFFVTYPANWAELSNYQK